MLSALDADGNRFDVRLEPSVLSPKINTEETVIHTPDMRQDAFSDIGGSPAGIHCAVCFKNQKGNIMPGSVSTDTEKGI